MIRSTFSVLAFDGAGRLDAARFQRQQFARAENALSPALGPAAEAENAGLMASLMIVRAEALDLQGRAAEAEALRLDSLGWARYGFGSEAEIRLRMGDIMGLNPARRSGRT